MTDIRTSALQSPIDIAEYLFRRLKQVGVNSCHGVPGDYNLVALDYVPKCGINWVGNCNELNAGYAADGYARGHRDCCPRHDFWRWRTLGAERHCRIILVTLPTTLTSSTLCVKLTVINDIHSEYVPVVHIVGTPSTISQANGMLLHHTLGNGDFQVFANMSGYPKVAGL